MSTATTRRAALVRELYERPRGQCPDLALLAIELPLGVCAALALSADAKGLEPEREAELRLIESLEDPLCAP